MTVTDLPAINASLNATAAVLLIIGLILIKTGRKKAHGLCMSLALVVSAAFLGCYLYYHYKVGHVAFAGQGIARAIYLPLLASHVILAVVNLPMIILTVLPAVRERFDQHKRWAKWTYPIWLYVSVTGVIVYMMCYVWFAK